MKERSIKLEELMTTAFNCLREAEDLTDGKIDIDFVLNVTGSYIISKEQGKLGEEYMTPAELFEENIFPIVDESELYIEEIEDGDTTTDRVAGTEIPKQAAN